MKSIRMAKLARLLLPAAAIAGVLMMPTPAGAAGGANTWTCSTNDSASGCSASTLAPMLSARSGMGFVAASSNSDLYTADGQTGSGTFTGALDMYSPSGNTWTAETTDPSARAGIGVAAVSGSVIYGAGGANGSYVNTFESYTVSTNSGAALANMPTARAYMGSAVGSNGWVYEMGGQNSGGYLATVEAYSPSASAWYCSTSVTGCTATASPPIAMPTARANFALVEGNNGLLYAIGGQTGASTYTNVVEAYNPTTRSWSCSVGDAAAGCSSTTITPMPTARAVHGDVTSNGYIYLVGGNNASNLSLVEVFNPTTNTWACSTGDAASGCSSVGFTPLPTARGNAGVAVGSDGKVYVIGGNNGSYLSYVEAFTPPTVAGAPTAVSAVTGSATATVTWTAPGSTGGMPITGYTITCTPACGSTSAGASATAAVVNGLTNGTAYTFSVAADNFMGAGATGTSASATPATCSAGSPSVAGAAPGTFPSTALNGSDHAIYTTLTGYTATDNACGGWNITFQAGRLTCTAGTGSCPAGGDSLPAGSLLVAPPTVSCNAGTSCLGVTGAPSVSIAANTALDSGAAVKVASAAVNSGEGSYTFVPGTISGANTNLSLTVPSYAYVSTYNSTVTVSIVSGP